VVIGGLIKIGTQVFAGAFAGSQLIEQTRKYIPNYIIRLLRITAQVERILLKKSRKRFQVKALNSLRMIFSSTG